MDRVTKLLELNIMLTAKVIRDAKPTANTRIIWDADVVGLGLRITKAGVKSFFLSYRADGRKRLLTLGRASELSLTNAREIAGAALVGVRAGIDPLEERKVRKALPTVSEGIDQYLGHYIPDRLAKGRLAAKTVHEYTRQIEKNIRPKIGKKRIKDVTKGDIEKILKPLPPVLANRVCALLSALFNQFEHWEYRPQHTNPARGIDRSVEDARDRTFSESELSALGEALEATANAKPVATLAIRLAAVTGLRIGEILNIRWDEIEFETGALILPKTKTGRRIHTLPSAALALLAETPRICDFIIPGRTRKKPMNYTAVRNHWADVCERSGMKGVRLHDLRRTIMTEAASLGVGSHLLRDFVGHKTTAMADRYARQAGAPLLELRERMGNSMAAKLDGKTAEIRAAKN